MHTSQVQRIGVGTRAAQRLAVERLLAWGFEPREIAAQLGCTVGWVYTIRRERRAANGDTDKSGKSSVVSR